MAPSSGTATAAPRPCALFLRVSTDHQETANQLEPCRRLATARGFEVAHELEEIGSAAAARRPVFDRLLQLARRREITAVVVWRLDRLHRNAVQTINTVRELDRLGVEVVSVCDSWVGELQNPLVRDLLLMVVGWVAELERATQVDRVRAGMARARADGRRIARPRTTPARAVDQAAELVAGGASIRSAARAVGLADRTLRRYLAERRVARVSTPQTPDGPSALVGRREDQEPKKGTAVQLPAGVEPLAQYLGVQ